VIPKSALDEIRRWADQRVPQHTRDQNLKSHECDLGDPTTDIRDLLDELDRDPTSIFWAEPISSGP
jgi:hypothetical protein